MTRFILYYLLFTITNSVSQNDIKSEDFLITNENIELPGTLTYSKNSKHLIIWVHGSGNVDRNGNQAGVNVNANYIKQFRDAVNKNDIAFFSYDKRTANPKNTQFLKGIVFDDLVSDLKSVIIFLKKKKSFKEIILVGHSQGSLIAMLASNEADKYISLAGPGEAIDQTIIKQVTSQSKPLGDIAKAHVKELKETGTIKEINPYLISLFAKPNHPFLSNWFQYNPSEEISKVKLPTLIINGDNDLQVKISDAKQLKASKSDAELKIIKNMNHVLKTVTSPGDNQASYFSSKFPISEELINVVTEFVKK